VPVIAQEGGGADAAEQSQIFHGDIIEPVPTPHALMPLHFRGPGASGYNSACINEVHWLAAYLLVEIAPASCDYLQNSY